MLSIHSLDTEEINWVLIVLFVIISMLAETYSLETKLPNCMPIVFVSSFFYFYYNEGIKPAGET